MASTSSIDTPERAGECLSIAVAAATTIHAGSLVAIDAAGNAVPASNTAGLRVVGRAEQSVDNSGGAAGAASILVKRGTFRYDNSAGSPLAAADLGLFALVEDDETVAKVASNNVKAGIVLEVDASFVWIDTLRAITG